MTYLIVRHLGADFMKGKEVSDSHTLAPGEPGVPGEAGFFPCDC